MSADKSEIPSETPAMFDGLKMSTDQIDEPPENPEISDKNWHDLPVEMKREIIKELDIETRANLRATCSTEKSIVDSVKPLYFKHVKIVLTKSSKSEIAIIETTSSNGIKSTFDCVSRAKVFSLLSQILTHGVIDFLEFIQVLPYFKRSIVLAELEKCAPFLKIKNFKDHGTNWRLVELVLKNSPSLDTVFVNEDGRDEAPSLAIIDLPAIFNAKLIQIVDLANRDFIYKLVEKWIEIDAEIGRAIQCSTFDAHIFGTFLGYFKSSIVSSIDRTPLMGMARISTKNPLKHIYLRQAFFNLADVSYVECRVISAADDDVTNRSTTWMRDVTPKNYNDSREREEHNNFKQVMSIEIGNLLNFGLPGF